MLDWLSRILKLDGKNPNPDPAHRGGSKPLPPPHDNPGVSIDHKKQGDACVDRGDWHAAVACYRQAIALDPAYADARNNLALALLELRDDDAASVHLQHIIAQNPDSPNAFNAYYMLGSIAHKLGHVDQAVEHFTRAVAIKPDFAEGFDFLGLLLRDQGALEQSIASFRKALSLSPGAPSTYSSLLFTLQFDETLDAEQRSAEHRQFARLFEEPLRPARQSHANDRTLNRRLKIGYISADFRRHSVAHFMLPVFARHDSENVETFCYFNFAEGDELTARFAAMADHFIACAGWSDLQLSDRIRADGIDILVDLAGHTGHHRLLTFARKPAPIQVTYLGYVDTTGLSAIDYRLTNADADPPGNDRFYSECLFRFEHGLWWCFPPAPDLPPWPPLQSLPALSNGFPTFCSTNQIAKIRPRMMDAWAEIMRAVPASRLVMMGIPEGVARRAMQARFAANGIAPERIDFHPFLPLDAYRRIVLQCDLCFDTFPFNGGTTTCETLALGLPMISMMGQTFASRMGYAVLNDIGLPELAATGYAQYVEIGIALANDLPRLATLRTGMRARLAASSLVDDKRFTENLESAYRTMWAAYLKQEPIIAQR